LRFGCEERRAEQEQTEGEQDFHAGEAPYMTRGPAIE
jgi:hypothetical protein